MDCFLERFTKKLNYIFIADKILNDEKCSCDADILNVLEVISRNAPIINIFPEIFGDYEQLLSFGDYYIDVKKILRDIDEPNQLLQVPGRLHETGLAASSRRKEQGSYYTPPYIIRYMIDVSLKYFFETGRNPGLHHLKIIDPACGGGWFLIETFNVLVEKGLTAEEAIKCIFGTDIDKVAVNTAIFVLTLAVLVKNRNLSPLYIKQLWEKQLRVGNALNPVQIQSIYTAEQQVPENMINWSGCFSSVFNTDSAGFDIVLGNPPYVSGKLIPPDQKKFYKNNFATALGQYDLSVLFFEQGINLLKNGGIVSYITSNKFMATDYGKMLRKQLLENCQIYEITDVSTLKCFKNTAVYPVIISFGKKQPSKDFKTKLYKIESWDELATKKPVQINQSFFSSNREQILTTQLTDSVLPIIQRINNVGGRIPEEKIRCGLAQTGFNKWVISQREDGSLDQNKFYPFIQAGHIEPFNIKTSQFIDKTKIKSNLWLTSKGPKLVIPGMAKEMKAAVDFTDSLMGRVYFVKEDDVQYDLGYLAVLFNSYVLNFYYKVMYWPVHLEGGYLRFNSTYLANVPLYSSECCDSKKASLIQAITQIGRILSRKVTDTDFKELKGKAEALTFLLYEISADEVLVIMKFLELPTEEKDRVIHYFLNFQGGINNAGKEN